VKQATGSRWVWFESATSEPSILGKNPSRGFQNPEAVRHIELPDQSQRVLALMRH
jgi:hypothetical protein